MSVESTVTEHTGVVGSELSDTITVDGFPDDHGSFGGNVKLGIGADRAMAQVSVWWAGDPNDSAGDEAYRPQGETPPAEDSNHRLIGVWDYPAVNGRIRVGAGARTLMAIRCTSWPNRTDGTCSFGASTAMTG